MNSSVLILAQYGQPTGPDSGGGGLLAGLFFLVFVAICLAIAVAMIAGMWKTFVKAGKPGWAAIIPIYNYIVLFEVVGRPVWWIIFFVVPFLNIVGIVFWIIVSLDLAKSFGKDAGFGIGLGLLPFVFYPILGFGSATYRGPAVASTSPAVA